MSNCVCISVGYDHEGSDFSAATIQTARKEHQCCECHRAIEPGQEYERVAGMWDGSWSTYKTCFPCKEVRSVMFCEGWIYGECWSRVRENFREGAPLTPCFEEVRSFDAREMLTAAFREVRTGENHAD